MNYFFKIVDDDVEMKIKKILKFKKKPIEVDGIKFASKKEAHRYFILSVTEEMGFIKHLKVHPKWDLIMDGDNLGTYTADFSYIDNRTGRFVVEDLKGCSKRDYKRIKKLMKEIFGVDITEV